MPRRDDISSVLVIGSGPIVIGQACEFDYSGTQACRVLREEGYRVILANSNPATIMTDPDFADRTYVEPLTPPVLAAIIEREQPDAVLPTLGGQTGAQRRHGPAPHWASSVCRGRRRCSVPTPRRSPRPRIAAVQGGDGRHRPRRPGVGRSPTPSTRRSRSLATIGLPAIVRPAYILGGRGTGIATTRRGVPPARRRRAGGEPDQRDPHRGVDRRLEGVRARGDARPRRQLRDHLLDRERRPDGRAHRRLDHRRPGADAQRRRVPGDAQRRVRLHPPRRRRDRWIERAVRPRSGDRAPGDHRDEPTGVAIVGAGVQGDRASRSPRSPPSSPSGTRSTRSPTTSPDQTPACFEPSIDYVVTKVPRWAFEKLPGTSGVLGTQMQSVGEVMAIGRTFPESLQKALRSLEQGRLGLNADPAEDQLAGQPTAGLLAAIGTPTPERIFQVAELLRRGVTVEQVHAACRIDEWFLDQIARIVEERATLDEVGGADAMDTRSWRRAKQLGFSDAQLAHLWRTDVATPSARRARPLASCRRTRRSTRAPPSSPPSTPYHYSTWEDEDEVRPSDRPRVVILGSGPNRIGQGIEFDYCCVHASFALSRGRLRDGDGQLQPGDGVDRLRHVRPPVLRAAHRRGRAQRHRRRDGGGGRRRPQGDRRPRRADAAEARRRDPRRARRRHDRRVDRRRRGPREVEPAVPRPRHPPAAGWHGRRPRPGARRRRRRSATRCSCARATCSAAGRCASSTTRASCARRWTSSPATAASVGKAACRPTARCSSTASSTMPSRSTSTPCVTTPARC